ncbi:MAG: ATP-binding protein [Bacilli bacterium]
MYEFSNLFFYKFQFILELLTAESLFLIHLKRKDHFLLRVILSLLFCLVMSFCIPIVSYDAIYISVMFFAMFLFTVAGACFCFDQPFINIIFCLIAGYTVQHIAYSVYQMIMISTMIDGVNSLAGYGSSQIWNFNIFAFAIYIDSYVLVYLISYFSLGAKIKNQIDFYITSKSLLLVLFIVVVGAIVLNSITVYSLDYIDMRTELIVSFAYSILSCTIALMFQFKLKEAKKVEAELEIVQHLWKEDKEHYELAKENINLINIKCHDLKHQIRAIRMGGPSDFKNLENIEKSIMIYDSIVKTGCDSLDVLLTEKSLYCSKSNISLTYMIDGEKLKFMSPSDIYSLFGNALDNSIEYLKKIGKDKRFVKLIVKEEKRMILVHIENYFKGDINLENGLPKTTKKDDRFHGYGLLSIKMITESYGGHVYFSSKNNLFSTDIIFPFATKKM